MLWNGAFPSSRAVSFYENVWLVLTRNFAHFSLTRVSYQLIIEKNYSL